MLKISGASSRTHHQTALPHTLMGCEEVVLPVTTAPTGVIANRHKLPT
jgi:hypothetical protein